MQKLLNALVFLCVLLALCSCAKRQLHSRPDPITLPVSDEPSFEKSSYSSLRGGARMVVLWSTADLEGKLKAEFPALSSERASLRLVEEELITSKGVPYRRAWFSYGDEATWSMHGSCNQNIYVWLSSSGEIAATYVTRLQCPV
jgi:hypothetical protein